MASYYNDKNSSFNELCEKDGSVSIYHQNFQKLAVEMFKISRGLSPYITNEIFQFKAEITCELRERSQFHIPFVHSVLSCTGNLKSIGPKIWTLVPNEMTQRVYRNSENNSNNGNLCPVPVFYAKDLLTGLGFFNMILLKLFLMAFCLFLSLISLFYICNISVAMQISLVLK